MRSTVPHSDVPWLQKRKMLAEASLVVVTKASFEQRLGMTRTDQFAIFAIALAAIIVTAWLAPLRGCEASNGGVISLFAPSKVCSASEKP
jgi:uncharacterized membrane protein SirB2